MAAEYSFEWCAERTVQFTKDDFKIATMPANASKNRYNNVHANDATRVILSDEKYINANNVCGGRYISCQAPTTATLEDFWRMNFELQVPVIVMLTNYTEKGRAKATQYFPDSGVKRYGNYNVKVVNAMFSDDFAYDNGLQIRHIQVQHRLTKETRHVVHVHYFAWPDFGVPSNLKIVTDIIFVALLFRGNLKGKESNGPIVVHCSAGIGRSGTYICMMRLFEHHFNKVISKPLTTTFKGTTDKAKELEDRVNAIDKKLTENEIREICAELVLSVRTERKGMIQTADQLSFLVTIMIEFYRNMYDKIETGKETILEVIRPFFSEDLEANIDDFMKPLLE